MHSRHLLSLAALMAATLVVQGASAAPPYNLNKETDKKIVNELTDEWADDGSNGDDPLPFDDQQDLNPDRLGLTDENIFIDASDKNRVPMDQQVGLLDDDGFQIGFTDYEDTRVGLLDDDEDMRVGLLDDDEDMRVGLLDDDEEEGPEEDNESIDVSSDDDNYDDLSFDDDDDEGEDELSAQLPKTKDDRYPTLNLDATDPEELDEIAAVEDENTDDSDLTEEAPWDAQQKEGEVDEDDDAVPNLYADTKEQHENPEPEPKPKTKMLAEMGDNNKANGLIIEDQIKKESERMLDAAKVDEPTRAAEEEPDTEDGLTTLDDYEVDSTVDKINDSLEKALNSIDRTNPLPLTPADDTPSFNPIRVGSQFFPDENDRRLVNAKPYTKPSDNGDGPSAALIFLATILLFLLYKSPRIKRYIVSRTNDYNKTLPYHAGKMRD